MSECKKYVCGCCGKPTDNIKLIYGIQINTCDVCQKKQDIEYRWQIKNEHFAENTIICPFCDFEYPNYELWEYSENDYEVECPVCGKKFDLEVRVTMEYSTKRSLCEMPEDYQGDDEDDE